MSNLSSNSEESLSAKTTGRSESRSSEDFSLHTVEVHDSLDDHRSTSARGMYTTASSVGPISPHRVPTTSLSPTPRGLWTSPEGITRACPCALDSTCPRRCCVQAVQRRRDKQVTARTKLLKSRTNPVVSYGTLAAREETVISPISVNDEAESVTEVQVIPRTPSLEKVHCGCHKPVVDHTTRKAVLKLVIASLIALLFMVGEVLGGYFANSLAIMTDAAHMLSDFAGFLISLFAIWVSRRPPSRGMSFGWHRAEVIGALVSVLLIWALTGVLFYEAILRVIHQDFEVDANIMLITAGIGVFVNVFMCMVLGHGHGHSHGGGGHGHAHNKGQSHRGHGHTHNKGRGHKESGEQEPLIKKKRKTVAQNINVRAAFIHVLGDIIQSIGVVIAGYIIWIWPSLKLADPICTFIFCVLVLISTFNILKDALRVVMEGTPKNIDYEEVKADLNSVEGVRQAHSLHIWSLTLDKTALAAHLVLDANAQGDKVLARANQMLRERHQITTTTLQVEGYQQVMDECGPCQEPERTGVLRGLLPSCLQPARKPVCSRGNNVASTTEQC